MTQLQQCEPTTYIPSRAYMPDLQRMQVQWTPGRWIIVDGRRLPNGMAYVPGCGAVFASGSWRLYI